MPPVPANIADLSQTAGSNSPAGSESPALLDDYHRTTFAFIAKLRDGQGFSSPVDLASAATTDIGAQTSLAVRITGTTTITSFGSNYAGPRFLTFAGALTLTHNATSLILPGGANITTAAGDACIAVPNLATPTGWRVVNYQKANGGAVLADLSAVTGTLGTGNGGTGVADGSNLTLAGMIAPFAQTTAPTGWLALPLTATNISRTTYANLFAAIGTTWGAGDGSTTFGCPYMPTNYTAVQASANVGTATTGEVKAHTHTIAPVGGGVSVSTGPNATAVEATAGINSGSTGGAANLAAGIRFLWCVKV